MAFEITEAQVERMLQDGIKAAITTSQTMADWAEEAERKSAEIHQQKMKLQQLERFKTYLQLKAEFES